MAFAAYEEGTESGTPATLYRFQYGSDAGAVFLYTDADEAVSFGGETYTPVPIGRESIKSAGNFDDAVLPIDVAKNVGIAILYRDSPPAWPVTLTLRQGHLSDPDDDFKVVWVGRIVDVERKDNVATLNCEPAITGLNKNGLRRFYQYGCPHVLYGTACGANLAAATTTLAVDSVVTADETINFTAGWNGAAAATKYLGGYVRWTDATGSNQFRTILRLTGDSLGVVVAGSIVGLAAGASIDVVLGCNHQESDCQDLHNNIVNYGGQPWIPIENPVGFVNRFY